MHSITTFLKLHLLLSKKITQKPCIITHVKRGWKSYRGTKWADVHTSPSKYRVRSNMTPFQNRQSSNIERRK